MPASYEDRLMRVLTYIHDNPAGDLSLDRLVDQAAMSRFYWHRVFRAMTGETCAQAVRRMRMFRAAEQLVQSRGPPDQIAAAVGYSNPNSFARTFADSFGMTPTAFHAKGTTPTQNPALEPKEARMFPGDIQTIPSRRIAFRSLLRNRTQF